MIRLNLSTDYALRTLLYLARKGEEQASAKEVAAFYGISADHVSKVVQHLSHAGMIRAGRGRGGGMRLGKPAEQISVGDVVELFEGPVSLLECVSREGVCVIQPGCRLRRLLEEAGATLIRQLRVVSLADLVRPEPGELLQIAALTLPEPAAAE